MSRPPRLLGALDVGTQSTRFIVFDNDGNTVANSGVATCTQYPHPGWSEQDPLEYVSSSESAMQAVAGQLEEKGFKPTDVEAIGITNQRETTVVWNSAGTPLHPSIVWNDARTTCVAERLKSQSAAGQMTPEEVRMRCGLPISSYFSALKLVWLMENCETVRNAVERKDCLFGTVDSWLVWNLGEKRRHITDVTNASRTMLMSLHSRAWDADLLSFFSIPDTLHLPEIRPSSEVYDRIAEGPFKGVPIGACLGDQQAALVGQRCFAAGQAKNTYGTGCFLLSNTGEEIVRSDHGLLSTVAFQFGDHSAFYALEGSIATAGFAVSWLVDSMGLIDSPKQISIEAAKVDGTGGVYFVPALTGLYAPHWKETAKGTIVGLSPFSTKAHICRALLEGISLQTQEVIAAMQQDSGTKIEVLRVDGGLSQSDLLLQMQSDFLGVPVERPYVVETTAYGAAVAAGLAVGVFRSLDEVVPCGGDGKHSSFSPKIELSKRERKLCEWQAAIKCCLAWPDTS